MNESKELTGDYLIPLDSNQLLVTYFEKGMFHLQSSEFGTYNN